MKRLNNGFSCARNAVRRPASADRGSAPNTVKVPSVGSSRFAATDISVVLPAPLGPTSPQIRPAGNRNEQSRSAQPRRYLRPTP